jgi:hypothetical protein
MVLVFLSPACFKPDNEPSIEAKFTLISETFAFLQISEFSFSVDVSGFKDAAVIEFDNGMPSISVSEGKAESRFFANIGTEEVTLVVRDSRGDELIRKSFGLEKRDLTLSVAGVEDRSGIYVLRNDELVFYSIECLENMTFVGKVMLLIEVIEVYPSYVVIESHSFGTWIWDYFTYPNNPKYDLTQDTLDTLGLPNFAKRSCEGGFFEVVTGLTLYSLDVDWNAGGEVEVSTDPDYALSLYKEGTEVTLSAIAFSGFYFGGWTGSVVSSEPEETVVMNEDKEIFGNFVEESEPYMVYWSYEPDPVCEGKEFEVTVEVQNATKVEISLNNGAPVVAEKNGDIYTVNFTAPGIPSDSNLELTIEATNYTKKTIEQLDGIAVLNDEGSISVIDFWHETFSGTESGMYLYITTQRDPALLTSEILVEGSFESQPEFVSAELLEEGVCLTTFSWNPGVVVCSDATLTARIEDYCGNTTESSLFLENLTWLSDDDVIFIGLDSDDIPCDTTFVSFPVVIDFFEELNVTEVNIQYSNGAIVDIFARKGELLVTGETVLDFVLDGIDGEHVSLIVEVIAEYCGSHQMRFESNREFYIDNVCPRVEFSFDAEPVVYPEEAYCDSFYNATSTLLTWQAIDNHIEEAILAVDLGYIEELVYDETLENWIWIDRGQETSVPAFSDGNKWRWNLEGQDCYYGTIALEAFDACGSDSTETTILVDNVTPDFSIEASIEECSDETCVTISWTTYDRCMTCGTGDCGSWDIGKIYFSHPDVNTGKDFANIFIDTCLCDGPQYSGTITWCFGNLDCETLVATIVGYDAAGNISNPWAASVGNTDTKPPEIVQFSTGSLMHDTSGNPYLELNWKVEDNCFDSVSVWVSQGRFESSVSMAEEQDRLLTDSFTPESSSDHYISREGEHMLYWFLDNPAIPSTVWISARDFCLNETVVINELEGVKVSIEATTTTGGTIQGSGEYAYGETVTLTALPNAGYVFVSWKENDVLISTDQIYQFEAIESRNLIAVFQKESFVISIEVTTIDDFGQIDMFAGGFELGFAAIEYVLSFDPTKLTAQL